MAAVVARSVRTMGLGAPAPRYRTFEERLLTSDRVVLYSVRSAKEKNLALSGGRNHRMRGSEWCGQSAGSYCSNHPHTHAPWDAARPQTRPGVGISTHSHQIR